MIGLLEALDSSAAKSSTVALVSKGTRRIMQSEIQEASLRAASWIRGAAGRGGVCAALLEADYDCLALVFGIWRAGMTLVSLPHPARGMTPAEYMDQIDNMCSLVGASRLLVHPSLRGAMSSFRIATSGFDEYRQGRQVGHRRGDEARFVQFTSGSTGFPKGVDLSLRAIDQNLVGTLEIVEPREDDVVTSWLPLSHDMGFIGLCLAAYRSMCRPFGVRTHLNLIRPEAFLARPGMWLETCSRTGTTVTAAPPFALRMAAKALRARRSRLDLSSIRVLIVGGERIDAEVLTEFAEVGQDYGLSAQALCPAYGLAENALAVTLVPPRDGWQARRVSEDALSEGNWVAGGPSSGGGWRDIVSCGMKIPGTDVRIAGQRSVGVIQIRGKSMMRGYVGSDLKQSGDSWFETADMGHIEGGSLFVVGRGDDVIVVAGRNLDPRDLERVAERHPMVRAGNCVAVESSEGRRYSIIAEPSGDVGEKEFGTVVGEIRAQLLIHIGLRPDEVRFVRRGSIPKTPSGKVMRHRAKQMVVENEFEYLGLSSG